MSELSEVQQDIQVLVKINKTFTRSITKIGTKGDGHALRSSLDKLQVDFQEMEDLIQKSLKSIKTSKNIARKLQEDVKSIISQFQASSKKKNFIRKTKPFEKGHSSPNEPTFFFRFGRYATRKAAAATAATTTPRTKF